MNRARGARWAALALAVPLFVLAIFLQTRVDQAKSAGGDELLYLPNERLLSHFTAGMSSVVADLLWLQCVQYTGKQIKGGGDFQWLQQMIDTVTRLDPHFVDVYLYGGILLSELKRDDDAGIRLLERGYVQNPRAWTLPHEIAMTYLIKRQGLPGAYALGAYYMGVAASTGEAPERVLTLAESLSRDTDIGAMEAELYMRMAREAAENGNDLMRQIAERKLVVVELRDVMKNINARAKAYSEHTGKRPESFDEMVRIGIAPQNLTDPLGGTFFLGPDGHAYSTTVLDDLKQQRLRVLENAVRRYYQENGRYPERLEQLLAEGGLLEWQPYPYPGQAWAYDPATGKIEN